MSLQKKLEESLREIEVTNNVVILFRLLIAAKKFVIDLKNKTKSEILTESQKICESINEVTAVCFLQKRKFLELLQVSDPKFKDFSRALLNINETVLQKDYFKLPYLKTLINETEELVLSSTKYRPSNFFPQEEGYLNILKGGSEIVVRTCENETEEILDLILEIRRNANSTEEENKTIGNLMTYAIEPIQLYIWGVVCTFRRRLDTSLLRKRSALQIMIDEYGEFMSEKSDYEKKLKESIKVLDVIIERWCDVYNSEDGDSDLESAGALDMPKEHTWWSKYPKPAVSTAISSL